MKVQLDWPRLVDEALRRRRTERLTQKEHAALAGVSVPTIIAFDRKETSLSLTKALDILRVVNLVVESSPLSSQDTFVETAEQRWTNLVSELPSEAPGRLINGHYSFDYEILNASTGSLRALLKALQQADHKYTGWPPFWLPTREAISPYPFDGGVECWLGRPENDHAFNDAAHSDFWRVTFDARLYLRRGYEEDSVDNLSPATMFDLTLPIWRVGEAMLHAYHLAGVLATPSNSKIQFRARYTGLAGRELKSWANPYREVTENYRCRVNEGNGMIAFKSEEVDDHLHKLVHNLLVPIYENFDFFQLPEQTVKKELDTLKASRTRRKDIQKS